MLRERIEEYIDSHKLEYEPYEDYFCLCRNEEKGKFDLSHKWNHELRERINKIIPFAVEKDLDLAKKFAELQKRSLLFGAPHFFDDYLQAVEYERPLAEKFYLPRRHYLKRYVDAYQEVLDGKLDFLSISMPKRSGKSQLGINFTCMLSGKFPNNSSLMEGTGDDLVNSFYKGCLEYLSDNEKYSYYDIFPLARLTQTNADIKIFNLNDKSRFPTVMCRSIDARQVGLSEATNVLYLDDMVEGYEESKNRQRLDEKWKKVSGDIIGRAIEGTPIVSCGTRYSLYDPMGRLQEAMRQQGKRMKILETPALDLITDESNFEYEKNGKKIFTTKYFKDQRQMLSPEQWESEFQQQPFEAKGLLFPKSQLNYFFELPVDKDPDCIVCVCDTAESGEDALSMPIAYVYGDEVYIVDVVFDSSPALVTKPQCARKIMEHKVSAGTFEANNAGTYFARDVDDILKQNGYICAIKSKRTISNKQTRMEMSADNIIKHFYFKDPSTYERGSQYDMFMRQVTTHTRVTKKGHDDAPDSLALLENELRNFIGRAQYEVVKRMW